MQSLLNEVDDEADIRRRPLALRTRDLANMAAVRRGPVRESVPKGRLLGNPSSKRP